MRYHRQLYYSFRNAFRGLVYAIKRERNLQIELVLTAIIIPMLLLFDLRSWEIIMIILMIGWVISTELINTIVERIIDILKPRVHPYARLIKDLMAAVVLLSSLVALIVGLIIILPHIIDLFSY